VPLAPDVDARTIARGTPGFSGADLANLVNEAALMAARAGKRVVTMFDFEQAKDKVMMGAERRSMVMTEEEKAMTAYHEGGHAIVNIHMAGNDPLHKVTIIPRGRALGVTWALPEKDRLSITKEFLEAKIAMCFGGRIAEQLIYGENHLNSGASSDIKQATGMARAMVTEYGMSEKLGPLRYVDNQEEVFLGHSVTRSQTISGATAKMIDEEVRRIVEEGEAKAREILSAHLEELHVLAKGLLEYETLNADEVKDLLAGKPIRQGGDHSGPHKPRSSIPTTGGTVTRPGGFEPKPAGR
jgi:cell division protease FtsH